MRITVFGASGKVGRLVVQELLEKGHTVVAFAHRNTQINEHANLTVITGDIHDAASIKHAMKGSETVLCALGSWGTPEKDILSTAVSHIIEAAKVQPVLRFVSVTGAEARAPGDKLSLLHRLSHIMLSVVGKKVLADSEKHIALLASSDLDWTVVRSPVMTGSRRSGYTLNGTRPMPWSTVSRQAAADAMASQIQSQTWSRQAPYIH